VDSFKGYNVMNADGQSLELKISNWEKKTNWTVVIVYTPISLGERIIIKTTAYTTIPKA
jgi:hypothetical protein